MSGYGFIRLGDYANAESAAIKLGIDRETVKKEDDIAGIPGAAEGPRRGPGARPQWGLGGVGPRS